MNTQFANKNIVLTNTFQAVVHFEGELLVLGYFTCVEPIAMIPRHLVHSEHWFISNHLAIPGPLEGEACDTRVSKWQGIKNSFLIQLNFLWMIYIINLYTLNKSSTIVKGIH